MTHAANAAGFRLSRIYAQGWNAGRTRSARTGTLEIQKVINPYTSVPERNRWDEGYANALRHNRQIRFNPSRVLTDPPAK